MDSYWKDYCICFFYKFATVVKHQSLPALTFTPTVQKTFIHSKTSHTAVFMFSEYLHIFPSVTGVSAGQSRAEWAQVSRPEANVNGRAAVSDIMRAVCGEPVQLSTHHPHKNSQAHHNAHQYSLHPLNIPAVTRRKKQEREQEQDTKTSLWDQLYYKLDYIC